MIDDEMAEAAEQQQQSGEPARVFAELEYQTLESWSRARRVLAKAEQLEGKENSRYVVTTLDAESWPARQLYEDLYCERGEAENRIKEQLSLFADRMSTETLRANQLRLYLSTLAYVMMVALRRLGLQGTSWGAGADGDDPAGTAEDRDAGEDKRAAGAFIAVERLSV